jgi:hypothetical protein
MTPSLRDEPRSRSSALRTPDRRRRCGRSARRGSPRRRPRRLRGRP